MTEDPVLKTKLIVIDDHPVVLAAVQGVCMTIPDLVFSGSARSVAEASALVILSEPDVAVVDMRLRDGDGFQVIKEIQRVVPRCQIVIFSAQEDPAYAERTFREGARAYLLKGAGVPEIREAIEAAIAGATYISPQLAQQMAIRKAQGADQTDPVRSLTTREFQVFQHLGAGKKSAEIAKCLSIGKRTVDTHRENIKNKLGCQTATDLVVLARSWAQS